MNPIPPFWCDWTYSELAQVHVFIIFMVFAFRLDAGGRTGRGGARDGQAEGRKRKNKRH